MAIGMVEYAAMKVVLFFLRLPLSVLPLLYPAWNRLNLVPRHRSIAPVEAIYIPSTLSRRSIRLLIHHPSAFASAKAKGVQARVPVHVNLHGSGFVLPCLGADAELCQLIADSLSCVVIDADYAKGPEAQFPAALQDVLDVVRWVLAQPDRFDVDRITIGGQSAGGNLAFSATAQLPRGIIKAIVAFYPCTDFSRRGYSDEQRMYKPYVRGTTPGWSLSKSFRLFCNRCYVPDDVDTRDPRLSPIYAESSAFPPAFIACGDADPLCKEGEAMIHKLTTAGIDAHFMLIPDAGHGWDRAIPPDDPKFGPLRKLAIDRLIHHLRRFQQTEPPPTS